MGRQTSYQIGTLAKSTTDLCSPHTTNLHSQLVLIILGINSPHKPFHDHLCHFVALETSPILSVKVFELPQFFRKKLKVENFEIWIDFHCGNSPLSNVSN